MTLKIMIFWDYDTQWGADRSRLGGPKDWGRLEFENTDRLLDLHNRYQVPACFAVVGAAALPGARPYHDPVQIRALHAAGHEVGSHTLYHEWLPALNPIELRQTLRDSKDALEQCTGAPVTAFVPPYNQPFDFARRGSISLSERRAVRRARTDIPALCRALRETGYQFARISYRTPAERLKAMWGHNGPREAEPETVEGITCLRLNHPAGFRGKLLEALETDHHPKDRYLVAYGHPHSLRMGTAQDEQYLEPFLRAVHEKVCAGQAEVILPRQLTYHSTAEAR